VRSAHSTHDLADWNPTVFRHRDKWLPAADFCDVKLSIVALTFTMARAFNGLDLMENVLATWQNLMAPHTFSGQDSQLAGVR